MTANGSSSTPCEPTRARAALPHAAEGTLDATAVLAARELVVVLGARPPAAVEQWLAARLATGRGATVLCGQWSHPAYLRGLLERGCTVYDAVLGEETLVFLDGQRGYRLPEGRSLPRAVATLAARLWQRIGEYVLLEGRVSAVYPAQGAFQLAEAERVWLVVKAGDPLPRVGEVLRVLARVFWGGGAGATQVFEALAWWPATPAGPRPPACATAFAASPASARTPAGAPAPDRPTGPTLAEEARAGLEPLIAALLPEASTVAAALAGTGCPLCRLVADARAAFYTRLGAADRAGALARELANSAFCAGHGWEAMSRIPAPVLARGLLPALADRRARVERVVAAVRQPATALSARRALRVARAALVPPAACPACTVEAAVTEAGLRQLLAHLTPPAGQAAYQASDGLCVRHLRLALARAPAAVLRLLVGRARAVLEALLADLALYYHRATWQFAHEPKGAEQTAWLRGIVLWAGARRAAGARGR
jgi:hypothetical protein